MTFDLVITNPFSWHIFIFWGVFLAIVAFAIIGEATVQEKTEEGSPNRGMVGGLLGVLAIAWLLLSFVVGGNMLVDQQWDRVAVELAEEANYTHVEIDSYGNPGRGFVAMDEDGKYVSGVIYEDTAEHYTVVLDR